MPSFNGIYTKSNADTFLKILGICLSTITNLVYPQNRFNVIFITIYSIKLSKTSPNIFCQWL